MIGSIRATVSSVLRVELRSVPRIIESRGDGRLRMRGIGMNKDNAKDYLPLVQALAEGKEIQISDGNARGGWVSIEDPEFGAPAEDYRIKPEPKEIWVNRFPDGNEGYSWYGTEESARRAVDYLDAVQVCYREVIK